MQSPVSLNYILSVINKLYYSTESTINNIAYDLPKIIIQVISKVPVANIIKNNAQYICDINGKYISSIIDENLITIDVKSNKYELKDILLQITRLSFINDIDKITIYPNVYLFELKNKIKIITNNLDELSVRILNIDLSKNIRIIDMRRHDKIIYKVNY